MKKYSFCILKKKNKADIVEYEGNINKSYIQIKFLRTIRNNVKEYFFAKGVYDNYGIIEYYENIIWEYKDKIILFTEEQYNIIDFCDVMRERFRINLIVQKVNLDNINRNQASNKLKIKKVFIENEDNSLIEEKDENKLCLYKKYYKIELIITLNKFITFIEIIKEAIFKLVYKINEVEFINIVEELDLIYGKYNS